MGNYISRTDVQRRLRKNFTALYTPAGSTAADLDIVDADIEAAEAEIDSELAKRYVVPVTDATAVKLCKAWGLTILEEYAYGVVPGRDLPKHVTERAQTARKQMARAGSGELSLGAATVPTERTAATDCIIVAGETPEFTRTKMRGF